MVLVHCTYCKDVFRLRRTARTCSCGGSGGYTQEGMTTLWGEDAVPLVVEDLSFEVAVGAERTGTLPQFLVKVPPKDSPRIARVPHPFGEYSIAF